MDDKGSTLICIWGLSPFAHEDDPARAILTAINMVSKLLQSKDMVIDVGKQKFKELTFFFKENRETSFYNALKMLRILLLK